MLTCFGYSVRVHRWVGSDDQRYHHDHAWWYWSLVLRAGYHELQPRGEFEVQRWRGPGSLAFYHAEHRHKVLLGRDPCWTLLVTGRPKRKWGFWIPGRSAPLRPLRYFSRYGHHPCPGAD